MEGAQRELVTPLQSGMKGGESLPAGNYGY